MTQRAPSVVMTTARTAGPHLTVAGELDSEGAVRLRAQLDDAITPAAHVTLDLSRVTHLSAEALTVLVHAYRRLRDGGGTLGLEAMSDPVVRVLRISGLHRVLAVETTEPLTAPATDLPVAPATDVAAAGS